MPKDHSLPPADPALTSVKREQAMTGCLLGCAVGDSLGLPYEGLSARRGPRLYPFPLRQRLVFGCGLVSDDTDHTVFVGQAMVRAGGDLAVFRSALAWRLRWWFATLPAGAGWATLRGIIRLWLGVPAERSGVRSAGNGAAMRSAIIGAYWCDDPERRRAFVAASTAMTHRDPLALAGAQAVAEVAAELASGRWAERPPIDALAARVAAVSTEPAWQQTVQRLAQATTTLTPAGYAAELGGPAGVSGFVLHSVPFSLYCWYQSFGDYRATVATAISGGGDTDTVAAIAGALAGITAGADGIPAEWCEGLRDWPHGTGYLRRLGLALAGSPADAPTGFSPALALRSPVFLAIVLVHGFRRLFPPYG